MPESKLATRGRPPSTTRAHVSQVALELFVERGFEETTMDDIAEALGVGRRTLFRYFDSKNDMVWGDFEWVLHRLRDEFENVRQVDDLMDALRQAVVASNTYPESVLPDLRIRMTFITSIPALQAHSMIRYAEWRTVVAEFAANRLGQKVDGLAAQAIGHAALAASTAAFVRWVRYPDEDLLALLDTSYRMLGDGYDAVAVEQPSRGI
ncbi:MAG: mycofactocin system transcriptional regulator [Solirubrobacteraceae bacterium]